MVTDYPVWDTDRPRGVLSAADREYLCASDIEREENWSRPARSQRERAIRERTTNAILDFSLLFHEAGERDLALIFNPNEIDNHTEIRHGMQDALALFFSEMESGKYGDSAEDRIVQFSSLLRNAIWNAEAKRRGVSSENFFREIALSVAVEFNVHVPEPVNTDFIADAIDRHALYELSEEEFDFYVFVQLQSEREVRIGRDAAAQFLEDVDRLRKEGVIGTDAFD